MISTDEKIFLDVAKELSAGIRDDALWTKAFALENGDEVKTKAHYIRLRVMSIAESNKNDSYSKQGEVEKNLPAKGERRSLPGRVFFLIIGALMLVGLSSALFGRKSSVKPIDPSPIIETKKTVVAPKSLPTDAELRMAGITVSSEDADLKSITLSGEINELMANKFKVVMSLSYPPGENWPIIFVNSKGGDIYSAMAIGRTIRSYNLSSVVVDRESECYSACVFILAAGEQRLREGRIGIHRPYAENPNVSSEKTAKWFEKISSDAKAYLREMRVRDSLFDDMVSVPPDQMLLLRTEKELAKYGLIGFDPVAEERITAVQMKKYGITDRSVFMQRNSDAKISCYDSVEYLGKRYTFGECMDTFLSGALKIGR